MNEIESAVMILEICTELLLKEGENMRRIVIILTALVMVTVMAACGGKKGETVPVSTSGSSAAASGGTESMIDYMVLVNKSHPLPDGWEDALQTIHFTNTVGNDVEVETKAYDAYLKLKAALEKEGIFVDLDSARRSVADQERIMKEFTEQYGKDYAIKTVAQPGLSEHHTGLALDLYLIIDGKNVDENEDMMQYPEIWSKIHELLPEYGFILRYLKDKEPVTGYSYEPWHIRYIDDPEVAKEITKAGITFEEYLGEAEH